MVRTPAAVSIRSIVLGLVGLLVTAGSAPAQAAPPTCEAAEYRQFDFWVGDWDVSVAGRPGGRNLITSEEKGCLIHEHWTGGSQTGQSFNFYDRNDGMWHQVWVSSTGSVLRLSGRLRDGAMVYEGEARRPDGSVMLHRLVFTPNADGTVRQHWTSSTDGGATWQDAFDGLYRRRGR